MPQAPTRSTWSTHALARTLAGAALAAVASACSFGSEAAFIGTSSLDTCVLELPVCNTTAGCKIIGDTKHLEGTFPGFRSFIVPTEGEAVIRVKIFWRERLGPGADTEIIWHEPACVDSFRYESQGIDIFADSNAQGTFVQEQRVFRAGEHLVEVRSDATASYLLRLEVLTPSEFEAEQQRLRGPSFPGT